MHANLRTGLNFCRVGSKFVFLDVQDSRYFALGSACNAAFGDWLTDRNQPQSAMNLLIAGGVLDLCQSPEFSPMPPSVIIPQATYYGGINPGIFETLRATAYLTAAKAAIRNRPISHIIARATSMQRSPELALCTDDVGAVVGSSIYQAGRVISVRDACLAKSLAAMRMLGRSGIKAQMVIGVRLHPFMAHSWVQTDNALITDRFDNVEGFTPILVS